MQLFMDGLVLYKHVCVWDTLMANPIAGWQRGYCLLFPFSWRCNIYECH